MSVYTTLNQHDLENFLNTYDVGRLDDFEGISEGIENTNYFVDTLLDNKRLSFVLTVFESVGFDDLPYFLELMAHLAEHDIPCAHPIASRNKRYLQTLKAKPAALVQRLPGRSLISPTTEHCRQVGIVLAQLHLAGLEFSMQRENPRGATWNEDTAKRLTGKLSHDDHTLLENELIYQRQFDSCHLPGGVIHADLFRDNVLFTDNKLTGVIDFYYACSGPFLYDIAITANDWCITDNSAFDQSLLNSLLEGYQTQRPITDEEKPLWQPMLRAGALRFWLSRLQDMHFPRSGELTHIKNPDYFRDVLRGHVDENPKFSF